MSTNSPDSFTEALDRTDALYFTMTVFMTIVFGDIAPVTHAARIVTMSQMVVGLLTVGVAARLLLTAVNVADSRKERPSSDVARRRRRGPVAVTANHPLRMARVSIRRLTVQEI